MTKHRDGTGGVGAFTYGVPQARRRELVELWHKNKGTLDGKIAILSGTRNKYARVTPYNTQNFTYNETEGFEFSWHLIEGCAVKNEWSLTTS